MKESDIICIEAEHNVLEVTLDDTELARCKESWVMPDYKATRGRLYKYIRDVSSASKGV